MPIRMFEYPEIHVYLGNQDTKDWEGSYGETWTWAFWREIHKEGKPHESIGLVDRVTLIVWQRTPFWSCLENDEYFWGAVERSVIWRLRPNRT